MIICIKILELDMFVVVVAPALVFRVGFSALLPRLVPTIFAGTMALPCRLNQLYDNTSSYYCDYLYRNTGTCYSYHGGYSNRDFYCGVFCLYVNIAASLANWSHGAALSFKE